MPKPNLILMFGEDTYRLHQKINHWKEEFKKKHCGEVNINEIEATSELSAQQILEATQSLPFLAEKRMVIVKNFLREGKSEEQKKIAGSLEKIPDFCILIFPEDTPPDSKKSLLKKIQEIGRIEQFPSLQGKFLIDWIVKTVKEEDGKISWETAGLLANLVGPNLWQLKNEIKKLISYQEGQEITSTALDLLVKSHLETSIFKFTDQLGQKNQKGALKTLQDLIESGAEFSLIFHMLIRQFRLLIEVQDLLRQGYSRYQMVSRLKVHPYAISSTLPQVKNFKLSELKKIYQALLQIEIDSKIGKIHLSGRDQRDFRLALEKLVVELCQ